MTQKFKVGDKVRILSTEGEPLAGFENGDIVEIINARINIDGEQRYEVRSNDGCIGYGGNGTFELENLTKKQRISTLERQVAELQAEVAALKAQPKPTEIAEMFAQAQLKAKQAQKTPNELRKAIIAEAKAFVEETQRKQIDNKSRTEGNELLREYYTKTEFIVNNDERTVVAIIRLQFGDMIRARVTARCAPDDVFNADIGKAIALGRALGLDVKRFEQAVKPTEVVVGQRVYERNGDVTNTVTKMRPGITDTNIYGGGKAFTTDYGWLCEGQVAIVDDTEAQY